MKLHELPNPLPLQLMDDPAVYTNLTDVPAESLIMTILDTNTQQKRKGTGTFRMVDPFRGDISYRFSEEDLQYKDDVQLFVRREDGEHAWVYQFEIVDIYHL